MTPCHCHLSGDTIAQDSNSSAVAIVRSESSQRDAAVQANYSRPISMRETVLQAVSCWQPCVSNLGGP